MNGRIAVWPDGVWAYEDEFDDSSWQYKSDDYEWVNIPDDVECIDEWVHDYMSNNHTKQEA